MKTLLKSVNVPSVSMFKKSTHSDQVRKDSRDDITTSEDLALRYLEEFRSIDSQHGQEHGEIDEKEEMNDLTLEEIRTLMQPDIRQKQMVEKEMGKHNANAVLDVDFHPRRSFDQDTSDGHNIPMDELNRIMNPDVRQQKIVEQQKRQYDEACKRSSRGLFSLSGLRTGYKTHTDRDNNVPPAQSPSTGRSKTLRRILGPTPPPADSNVDMSIGLRLALPDKLDIMCGREAPPSPGPQHSKGEIDHSPTTPTKKLLIIPEDTKTPMSMIRKKTSLLLFKGSAKFDRRGIPPSPLSMNLSVDKSEDSKEEFTRILRTCELQPTVHQIKIPPAHDFLMYSRICALMEGYDRLLMHQAKARKKWFDFSDLVQVDRDELEAMYLKGIGRKDQKKITANSTRSLPSPTLPRGNPFGSNRSIGAHSCTVLSVPEEDNPFGIETQLAPVAQNPFASSSTKPTTPKKLQTARSSNVPRTSKPVRSNAGAITKKQKPHPSIIKSLLECADDLVVEGYFCETVADESGDSEEEDQVQATVFSSQRQRQFVVCYRSSMRRHMKPVHHNVKQKDTEGAPTTLHKSHPVCVNYTFRDAYFMSGLEEKVFNLLNDLATQNPFCDVVYIGHAFGGALGIIGATRYAALYPMMTVNCHVFGSPKVGGMEFRHLVNSLPNLKVMRVENGCDPYVSLPEGPKWSHVGHTITISSSVQSSVLSFGATLMKPMSDRKGTTSAAAQTTSSASTATTISSGIVGSSKSLGEYSSASGDGLAADKAQVASSVSAIPPMQALAYRFDERRPSQGFSVAGVSIAPLTQSRKEQGKRDHEMRSYLHALEEFTHLGLPWISRFVGEEGSGIVSHVDNEERLVV
eukprot:CAMPEP_0198285960 /NCGR_PEP_ID=MMETSP1449-20131203/5168_1 /TAXON_ID=420275 /ORGANISM="Attheya septentrionalis, Strain CCMP2084" /LENGTH=855 /DNA_ID=CAMNT_0043983579 /DNA_START=125 /DNA_END=2692 /DNA_ORIENTATION=+